MTDWSQYQEAPSTDTPVSTAKTDWSQYAEPAPAKVAAPAVDSSPSMNSWKYWNPADPESIFGQTIGTPGTKTDALVRGGIQGATLSLAPKAQAIIKSLNSNNPSQTYSDSRDEYNSANQAAQQAHSGYYLGGNLVGGLPTALVTGGASAPGMLGVANVAGKTALVGGVGGLGQTADSMTDLGKNVLSGGAVGGVLGAAGGSLQKFLGSISDYAARSDIANKISTIIAQKAPGWKEQISQITGAVLPDSLKDKDASKLLEFLGTNTAQKIKSGEQALSGAPTAAPVGPARNPIMPQNGAGASATLNAFKTPWQQQVINAGKVGLQSAGGGAAALAADSFLPDSYKIDPTTAVLAGVALPGVGTILPGLKGVVGNAGKELIQGLNTGANVAPNSFTGTVARGVIPSATNQILHSQQPTPPVSPLKRIAQRLQPQQDAVDWNSIGGP